MTEPEDAASSYARRLESWARESADLHADMGTVEGDGRTPEEDALRRYRRSTTRPTVLPSPLVSAYRYETLTRRHRMLVTRLVGAVLTMLVLVVLLLWVDPAAARIVLGALLVVPTGVVLHHLQALVRLERERHVRLQGGLADAWRDWLAARARVEALDGAAQARGALAANEARMQSLVLALAEAQASGLPDSGEQVAAVEWVHRSAAMATALADAEWQLARALAPDGDLDSLQRALDTTRFLTRGGKDAPPGA